MLSFSYTGWSIWSVGWVVLTLIWARSAWADGKLAELAEQVGKMVEHLKSKSTQPNYLPRWTTLHKHFPSSQQRCMPLPFPLALRREE